MKKNLSTYCVIFLIIIVITSACLPMSTPTEADIAVQVATGVAQVVEGGQLDEEVVSDNLEGVGIPTDEMDGFYGYSVEDISGTYRLRLPQDLPDSDFEISVIRFLVLNNDLTMQYELVPIAQPEDQQIAAEGTWRFVEGGFEVSVYTLYGNTLSQPEIIRYTFNDGFPEAVEFNVDGALVDFHLSAFTLGSGESDVLFHELHRRLSEIDYLDFIDPGNDLFTEETRQAIVRFQTLNGLIPTGEVDVETWVLLGTPPAVDPDLVNQLMDPPKIILPDPNGEFGVPDLDQLPEYTEDGSPILYLTFDDGPSSFTPAILDVLEAYNASATFFALGTQVNLFPEYVRAAAAAGHYIANHTFDHPSLAGLSLDDFTYEVETTRQIILETAGDLFDLDRDIRYLRPPYGATDANTLNFANEQGYAIVLWSIDPQDWRTPGTSEIANHVISHTYPGAIVLMHDGGGDRSQTIAALDLVLSALSGEGYVFRNIFLP